MKKSAGYRERGMGESREECGMNKGDRNKE